MARTGFAIGIVGRGIERNQVTGHKIRGFTGTRPLQSVDIEDVEFVSIIVVMSPAPDDQAVVLLKF